MSRKRKREPSKIGQTRSNQSFRRQPGNRVRRYILIVCGGEQTEPNYFHALRKDLKLSVVEVQIEGEGYAPVTLIESAIARRERREREAAKSRKQGEQHDPPFDEVWCIFDTERIHDNPSFQQAVDMAHRHDIEPGVSNPAFEYWYLLHFVETSRPFSDATELIRFLKNHLPDYVKNQDVYRIIAEHTETAIERADKVLRDHKTRDPDNAFPNPSTYIYKLVEKLQSMAR